MTSSPERAWVPPALSRAPSERRAPDGPWKLTDLGAPLPAPSVVDASWEAGHAEGLREGAAQSADHLRPTLAALGGVVRALDSRRAEILGDRQRDVQALALAVARRIVQREVAAAPEVIAGWVTRALELLPHDLQVDVRLHPDDLDVLGEGRESVMPPDSGVVLRWIGDAALDRGGFVVESPHRLVDGRLDVALRALYERFDAE